MAALSLASVLQHDSSHRPMLVAIWEEGYRVSLESSIWAFPGQLLQRLLPEESLRNGGWAHELLLALIGNDCASQLLSDMASDLDGGRTCCWRSRAANERCEALEIRSVKVSGTQRFLLCAVLRSKSEEQLESDTEDLRMRHRMDMALNALTELAIEEFNGFRKRKVEAPRASLRYHAEVFDSEVFCSRAMSVARLPSALVTLTSPKGGTLEAGVYCACISQDLGAVLAIKSTATFAQVLAEISFFQRPSGDSQPMMVPLESISTSGSLHDLRWLRPFYYKLATNQGSSGLQKQVQLDVVEASEQLWPTKSAPSKRRRMPDALIETANLPPSLVMTEILPYVDLPQLPTWAVNAHFYEAANKQAAKALVVQGCNFPAQGTAHQ